MTLSWVGSTVLAPDTINFVGKGIVYLDCWRNKPQFQLSLLKKRNEVFYLDVLSNILDVSYALFHLIKKKK